MQKRIEALERSISLLREDIRNTSNGVTLSRLGEVERTLRELRRDASGQEASR